MVGSKFHVDNIKTCIYPYLSLICHGVRDISLAHFDPLVPTENQFSLSHSLLEPYQTEYIVILQHTLKKKATQKKIIVLVY